MLSALLPIGSLFHEEAMTKRCLALTYDLSRMELGMPGYAFSYDAAFGGLSLQLSQKIIGGPPGT